LEKKGGAGIGEKSSPGHAEKGGYGDAEGKKRLQREGKRGWGNLDLFQLGLLSKKKKERKRHDLSGFVKKEGVGLGGGKWGEMTI